MLLAILAVGLIRGLYWVAMTEVPGPIDEAAHLAYIESIATGHGIPVVGADKPSENILKLQRFSTTGPGRYFPLDVKDSAGWGPSGEQYEAIQPPLYYLIMALPFRLAAPSGIVAALYTVRILSLVLALAAVPLIWLLARELFPRLTLAGPLSAGALVAVNGYNASLSSVTNDALVLPLSVAALWLLVRGWHRQTLTSALACGLVTGLAILSKSNAAALLVMVPLAMVILPRVPGRSRLQELGWVAATGVAAGLTVVPWLAWNLAAYGTVSGGGEITSGLLSSLVPVYGFNPEGIRRHLVNATSAFWRFRADRTGPYEIVLFAAAGASLLAGAAVALRRKQTGDAAGLALLALTAPAVFAFMIFVVYTAYTGSIVGRHMYPAMAPLVVGIAAGTAIAFGKRGGTAAVVAVVLVALFLERQENRRFIDDVYLRNVVEEGVAPVTDQNLNTAWVTSSALRITAPCPVRYVGIAFEHHEPAVVIVVTPESGPAPAIQWGAPENGVTAYKLMPPYPKDFVLAFREPASVGSAPSATGEQIGFLDSARFPMAQLHCRVPDWQQNRFSKLYDQNHPSITYRQAVLWADLWAWGCLGVALAGGAGVLLSARLRKRSPGAS
jgi:4-amino-4-deoxy-L-arabinose transferase-like glycosyltransferase